MHELMGNRFMVRDVPAWHALGTVFTTELSATEAAQQIGADEIQISKLPYQVDVPGFGLWTPDKRYVLIRHPTHDDPTPRNFGEVGADYCVLQNMQIAQLVDILIEGTKTTKTPWKLETAGILRDGETIFFALKGETYSIAGDDIGLYFGVSDQRNGGSAIDLAATPVKYVCANTLRMGLNAAKSRITIRHHQDLLAEVTWRMELITQAIASGKSMLESLKRLEKISIDENRAATILDKLFPTPKPPKSLDLSVSGVLELENRAAKAKYHHKWSKERNEKVKVEIKANYDYETEKYGKTGWAMFNAVTGWIDHQSGKNTPNGKRVMAERSLSAEMDELRTKAYNLIVARV